jgi:hypothetical protein
MNTQSKQHEFREEIIFPIGPGQESRLKSAVKNIVVRDGIGYLSVKELHGVFFVNSRQQAKNIIVANIDTLSKIEKCTWYDRSQHYISEHGIYALLTWLVKYNPVKATLYRKAIVYVSYAIALTSLMRYSSSSE